MSKEEETPQEEPLVWIAPFIEVGLDGKSNRGILALPLSIVEWIDKEIEKRIAKVRNEGGTELEEIAAVLGFINTLPD